MNEEIYLKIPTQYYSVYKTLLIKLSDLGEDLLKECSCDSNTKTKYIINCWNMFQAACAAYYLNETKKAELLINYITKQLKVVEIEYPSEPDPDEPIVQEFVYYYGGGVAPTTVFDIESSTNIISSNSNINIEFSPNSKYFWIASKSTKRIFDILANPDTAFEQSINDSQYIVVSNVGDYVVEQFDYGIGKMNFNVQVKLN